MKSTFTGSNWGILWRSFAMALGMYATLFIATPWLFSWYYNWYYSQFKVDGKQLSYTSKGRDFLFFFWYVLLIIVTLGIASLFMMAYFERRVKKFLHVGKGTGNSTFTGSNFMLIVYNILVALGIVFTLGIGTPWLMAWYYRWYYSHHVVDDKVLKYTAKGRDFLFVYLIFLVSILTFGIGIIFMMAYTQRKILAHLHF